MKLLLVLFICIFSMIASAEYKLGKLNKSGHRVKIISQQKDSLKKGDKLIATDEFGESCHLKVIRVHNDTPIASTEACKNLDSLKRGQSVKKFSFDDILKARQKATVNLQKKHNKPGTAITYQGKPAYMNRKVTATVTPVDQPNNRMNGKSETVINPDLSIFEKKSPQKIKSNIKSQRVGLIYESSTLNRNRGRVTGSSVNGSLGLTDNFFFTFGGGEGRTEKGNVQISGYTFGADAIIPLDVDVSLVIGVQHIEGQINEKGTHSNVQDNTFHFLARVQANSILQLEGGVRNLGTTTTLTGKVYTFLTKNFALSLEAFSQPASSGYTAGIHTFF